MTTARLPRLRAIGGIVGTSSERTAPSKLPFRFEGRFTYQKWGQQIEKPLSARRSRRAKGRPFGVVVVASAIASRPVSDRVGNLVRFSVLSRRPLANRVSVCYV
jgi:hypothetical protein